MSDETTGILVDGVEHDAPLGGRLIDFLHELGKEIPHFCYHPGLSVEASCRQCQVESKGRSTRPGLIVSCRETIVPGMEILTDSEAAREARRGVMEFLLMNHPLDCPICDKAGECLLQDTAYETGQAEGRSHEARRALPKRKSLGDTILLDNERCILCTRCVRFFEEVTQEPQLTVTGRGDRSVLTTFMDEPLTGNYQGNVVDLCPVGALTLKKFRFESRVWFLKETKTICGICSRGCNTVVETRDGDVFRIRPRHNQDVNGYWMCDEGRLEFDRFNLDVESGRLGEPMVAGANGLAPAPLADAIDAAGRLIASAGGPVVLLLSPWATIEEGQAFRAAFERSAPDHAVTLGFLRPAPTDKADDLLHTDDPAPNCRGLAGEVGLAAIDAAGVTGVLEGAHTVLLAGWGLTELLPQAARAAAARCAHLVLHAHMSSGFESASVAFPAATPTEKSGYWVNAGGRRQYVRAAQKRPIPVPADRELFAALGTVLAGAEGTPA